MGRSQETFRKKENIKKREQKKKDKELRKENRNSQSDKGKSLEDMLAYVDENGNLTTEKPSELKKQKINVEEIQISTPKMVEEDDVHKGKVAYYNDERGWGFINNEFGERVFFLITEAPASIKVDDVVNFRTRKGPKGLQAYEIQVL
ncbi:cold shock domain-containing protein [Olivibacter sp. CPCC 100613]|uniref:cold-shock protein n=1 Tax=Olivibacter sp. CPCC 100613 TaxID=3079931 RepID=UPI002FF8D5A5